MVRKDQYTNSCLFLIVAKNQPAHSHENNLDSVLLHSTDMIDYLFSKACWQYKGSHTSQSRTQYRKDNDSDQRNNTFILKWSKRNTSEYEDTSC